MVPGEGVKPSGSIKTADLQSVPAPYGTTQTYLQIILHYRQS